MVRPTTYRLKGTLPGNSMRGHISEVGETYKFVARRGTVPKLLRRK
jgi:hypothetical protein